MTETYLVAIDSVGFNTNMEYAFEWIPEVKQSLK